jgi:hypothetical protein
MSKPQPSDPNRPDLVRRRLTRAGVVAPVVLGSLASQPVLGQTYPYHCTVSGHLSGNTSYRVGKDQDGGTMGAAPTYWSGSDAAAMTTLAVTDGSTTATLSAGATWPFPFSPGTLPTRKGNDSCSYDGTSSIQGTLFSAPGFANVFFQVTSGSGEKNSTCNVVYSTSTVSGGKTATMLQVLLNASKSKDFEFAAIAIASLLSAENEEFPRYPLRRSQIVAMYNATQAGGTYFHTTWSGGWNRDMVASFLSSLMPYDPEHFATLLP